MRVIFIFILGTIIFPFHNYAQSSFDLIKQSGYQIKHYEYDNYSTDGYNKELKVKTISLETFLLVMKGDVFGYFPQLGSTELEKNIYLEDHPNEYELYKDSLKKIKIWYKSNYEYKHYRIRLGEYSLSKGAFYLNSFYKTWLPANKVSAIKNGAISFDENFNDQSLLFTKLPFINHEVSTKKEFEILGVPRFKSTISTTLKIKDKRLALFMEKEGLLDVLVLFNRYDVPGKIYRPRKVILSVADSVIQTWGSDSIADSFLSGEELEVIIQTEEYLDKVNYDTDRKQERGKLYKSAHNDSLFPAEDYDAQVLKIGSNFQECKDLVEIRPCYTCIENSLSSNIERQYRYPDFILKDGNLVKNTLKEEIAAKIEVSRNGEIKTTIEQHLGKEKLIKEAIIAAKKIPDISIKKDTFLEVPLDFFIFLDISEPKTKIVHLKLPSYSKCENGLIGFRQYDCVKNELRKKITENIQIPDILMELGFNGTLHLKLSVNESGEIKSVEIIKGGNDILNFSIIKTMESLPNLNPGKWMDNQTVQFIIPFKVAI